MLERTITNFLLLIVEYYSVSVVIEENYNNLASFVIFLPSDTLSCQSLNTLFPLVITRQHEVQCHDSATFTFYDDSHDISCQ